MSFIKNIFRRILGKSPNSRSKSENRHDNKVEQQSSVSNSVSKLDNSLGLIVVQKSDNQNDGLNNHPTGVQNVSNPDKPKKHQIPELTSLASARRQLHEIHNNSARGQNDSDPKLKSYLLSVEQLPRYENKAPKNGRQLPTAKKKSHKINKNNQQPIDSSNNISSNNTSFSKDQPKAKINVNNGPINEEKVMRIPHRVKQYSYDFRQPREKNLQEGSSGSPTPNFDPLDRIFMRSEAYVQKNRQNLAKALKNIELLDNNPVIPKIQPQSELNKPKVASNQILRSNSGRNRLHSYLKPKPNAEFAPIDFYKRGYDKKESLSPIKGRTEPSILYDRTQGTIREGASSVNKLQSEGDDKDILKMDPRNAAWRRYEIKSRGVHQSVSSFENEMERVDRWHIRNSHAMADLVSIRENLLELYLKEDIKMHKNRQRSLKNHHP